jgi:DNA-binding beta-propeller fold protein YncE
MKVQFRFVFPFALLFSAFSLFFFSCKPDPIEVAKTRYEQGVFIVNEGSFGAGTGTLTYYNPDSNIVVQDVFGKENNGASLGNVLQSMTIHNGKAYCVVNNANKVMVLDAKTMKYLDTIGGLAFPRYFLGISDSKGYVSQWGADGLTGSIQVIDLVTNKVTKSIALDKGSDRMLKAPLLDEVYVVNEGGYGSSNIVSKINTKTDEVITSFTTRLNPNSLVWYDVVKKPIILSGGDWSWNDPTSPGSLALIRDTDALNLGETNNGAKDLCINSDGKTFYFTDGIAVYEKDDEPANPAKKLFDQTCYALFFDAKNKLFYCTDDKGFLSEGELVIRKLDGTIVKTIPTGIGPGEVIFR